MQKKVVHVLICFFLGFKVRNRYPKLMAFSVDVIFYSLIRMISRQKVRDQFLFLVRKTKHESSCCAKHLALTF